MIIGVHLRLAGSIRCCRALEGLPPDDEWIVGHLLSRKAASRQICEIVNNVKMKEKKIEAGYFEDLRVLTGRNAVVGFEMEGRRVSSSGG